MNRDRLSQGVKFLSENGFNIFSSAASRALPEDTRKFFNARKIDLKKYPTIVVIGSGGRRLWEAMHCSPMDPENPVNHFTLRIVNEFIKTYLNNDDIVTVFPSQPPRFPIQTFAHWLGWAHPTPLGKNVHKEFGSWHAYRSAFLTTLDLPRQPRQKAGGGISPETPRERLESPCDTCEDRPCVKGCPSKAVGEVKRTLADFDKKKCLTFRLKENSPCRDRCLARIACPVGREHKYTMRQMNHHYLKSRRSIIEKHNKDHQYGHVTV